MKREGEKKKREGKKREKGKKKKKKKKEKKKIKEKKSDLFPPAIHHQPNHDLLLTLPRCVLGTECPR